MDERMNEMLMKRAFFSSFFYLVSAASFVAVMLLFAMFSVRIDRFFPFSEKEVDHIAKESAENNL